MAFIPAAAPTPFLARPRPRSRIRRRPRSPRLALSEPDWGKPRPHHLHPGSFNRAWPPPPTPTPPTSPDYHGWSSDFIELCDAQLQLLASTVPHISQVLLFFRRENPTTGALEFVPLVVHSRPTDDRSRRVWITAPGGPGHTELESVHTSPVLPGGIPAEWILPDYPFKSVGEQGGILMQDGGLCIPVEYNGVLAGSVVLCPEVPTVPGEPPFQWAREDIKRADMVAKSIALGAALEGKWHASAGMLGTGRSLIDSMRTLLRTTLHQVRSPVSALVTFGHLLLRKLPPRDSNRTLAKNIILEALRVDDLLKPLDEAGDAHVLPEAGDVSVPWYVKEEDDGNPGSKFDTAMTDNIDYTTSKPTTYPTQVSPDGLQLLWLSDILEPQAEIAKLLATEKEMTFSADIDDDTPPVLAVEKYVREAVSNLFDNSLKYSPPGSYVGISCAAKEDDNHTLEPREEAVEVIVWDTGYGFSEDEKDEVWEFGYRGSAAVRSGSPGSGIGLSTVREMLRASGAEVSLVSPLPAQLDPRKPVPKGAPPTPGSAFILAFKRSTQ